jgi:hypothetical protein
MAGTAEAILVRSRGVPKRRKPVVESNNDTPHMQRHFILDHVL